ncbi:hypothetical protein D0469_07030 [Peribacillus saganii]|uniref:Large polyvalent protein associated domain-containing protein n=1 Tax=Peribacillus saganii TaxID=2303992 RepID=A0A372LQZ4_9BACI|nr:hypothetical protein [Peribacillus saganii]RFU70347.1 hypothetical protein D0469_07030 [Peribacillus saganii]
MAGGLAEAGISATNELANSEAYKLEDHAIRTGLGVAGGAILDPALFGIGKLLKGRKGTSTESMVNEDELLRLPVPKLGLPEPQTRLPEPSRVEPTFDTFTKAFSRPESLSNPIPQMPEVLSRELSMNRLNKAGLGFGYNTKNTPKPRPNLSMIERPIDPMNRGQQYWQNRYEDFVKTVQSNYDTNRLTEETLDDLWSQFAKYDEPLNLYQVVDLAYPKGFEAPPVPKQPQPEAPLKAALRGDERINELLKGFYPPTRPEPKISRQATLDEMFQRMRDLAPPKKETPTLEPLQFNRLIKTNQAVKESAAGAEPSLNRLRPGRDYEPIEAMPREAEFDNGGKLIRLKDGDLPREGNEPSPSLAELQNVKDISQLQVGTMDPYRIAERLPQEQSTRIISNLDKAKKANIDYQERITNDLYEKVVKGLGIKKGSKESALVQDFGEKTLVKKYLRKRGIDPKKLSEEEINKINLQQLKKTHPDSWSKIIEADKYFRTIYNQIIDEVNNVRSTIYPNNPEKLVPKRSDYYHHFNELTGFEGVRNLFDTPANIDPHLEGVSPYTKPNTKFQGFMQKRGLGKYKSDAVGGFIKYLQAASHSINIDPVIPVLKKTANEIADATEETRNANKIIEALQDHANDLAGKTNPYDRLIQKMIGRKGVRITSALNSRVKSNMIVGNLASALGQVGSVPLGIGKAKQYSIPGLRDTLIQAATQITGKANKSNPTYQSQFLKERFSDKLYRRFDQRLIEQPKKLAIWLLETADKSGTTFIWNSMYHKGLKEGATDAVKFADAETRKIVAGRGVGEVPLLQKSKTMQILAPFTLEVGNQWRVLKDMVGEKDAVGLMTFLVASYGLNEVMQQIRGSAVSFDPVGAIQEGFTKTEGDGTDKTIGALASLNGEVVGNIPGGNLLTQFANTEKKVPFTDLKYKELFGERNPNRFGTGLTVSKALNDPLYALLPFGAAQVRKSTKGLDAMVNGGVYKEDSKFIPFSGDKSELMYPIEEGSLENIKLPLFGTSAVSGAREYYNNKRKPLSEKQTATYEKQKELGNGKQYYDALMVSRRSKTLKNKVTDIQKDKKLSEQEKLEKIQRVMTELQSLKN